MTGEASRRGVLAALVTIAVPVVLTFLREAYVFFVPTLFALYITLMLLPLHAWLARALPGRLAGLASLITAFLPVAVLALAGLVVAWVTMQVTAEGAAWRTSFVERWQELRAWADEAGLPVEQMVTGGSVDQALQQVASTVGSAVMGTLEAVTGIVIVLFLVILLVSERPGWRRKTREVFRRDQARAVMDVAYETARQVRLFLLWRTITGVISSLLVGGLLWIVDVDLIPLWMLLQLLLNYVPNVGSMIAGFFPTVFAFVQLGWERGLVVMAGIFAIEQLVGNYLDPKLQGRSLSLSPAAVLVALLLFGWVWGTLGMLLAAPIVATVRTIARNVGALEPLAVFLGGDPGDDDPDEV